MKPESIIALRAGAAKLLMANKNTYNFLLEKMHSDSTKLAQEFKTSPKTKAIPARFFTLVEKQKIIENYQKSPEHLKKMIEAALTDPKTKNLITQPFYSPKTGEICSATPAKDNLIPCNTLIKVLEILLNMTDYEDKPNKNIKDTQNISLYPDAETPRAHLTEEHINQIEIFYQQLGPTSQAVFDLLCRNTAQKIFYKAVFLPDGYIYEEMPARAIAQMTGRCNVNPAIPCTVKDITPCQFQAPVLEQLKKCAETAFDNTVKNQPIKEREKHQSCRLQ